MGASTLSIAITGLNAAQAGLLTTSHNISNSNTAGYSRQIVQQTTQNPYYTGGGFIGQGTRVLTVQRQYSAFLGQQLTSSQASTSSLESYQTQLDQIDNMLADKTVGLSPAMKGFYDAVNEVAANPSSISARQSMLSGAQSLVSRFQDLSDRLREIGDGVNKQLTSEVANINSMAREIAALNQRIITAEAAGGQTQPSNDLRDQRDQLMLELNKHINATAMEQADGSYSVFFGNGQPLVVGRTANALVTAPADDDPTRMQVGMTTASGSVTMLPDSFIKGGALGGLLAFRTQSLDDTQNQLGLMAMGIASAFNDQHALGQDLTGVMGGDFFNLPTLNVIPNANNVSPAGATVSLTLDDVSAMKASDYTLDYDGVTSNYTLRRLSDNTTVFTGNAAALTAAPIDGMTFTITGTPNGGDSFRLQPTRYAARDISVAITDARNIAAASPVTTTAATANNGTAVVSPGEALDPGAAIPAGGFQLRYDLATNSLVFDTTSGGSYPSGPVSVSVNGVAVPGSPFTINAGTPSIPYTNGMTVVIDTDAVATTTSAIQFGFTGVPAHGDTFSITQSAANTNDNRNALALAKVQTNKVLLGGTASVESTYAQMVSLVGNKAREIDVNFQSQSSLLEQAQLSVQSLSGVNLDEEAANLLRYQQAYQASAKIIDISGRLFDLLASLGS